MITLYGINNCDTIKKTRKWLETHNVSYEFHDYKKQGIDATLAKRILAALPLETVINKRGTTWRKLASEVQENLNNESAVQLMLAQPSVIRRPLLHGKSGWVAAYNEAEFSLLTDNA